MDKQKRNLLFNKLLYIIGAVIVVGLILFVYLVFFFPKPEVTLQPSNTLTISDCQPLDQADTLYILDMDIGTAPDTCFTVEATGIEFDGDNHLVQGNVFTGEYGIRSDNIPFVVRNVEFRFFDDSVSTTGYDPGEDGADVWIYNSTVNDVSVEGAVHGSLGGDGGNVYIINTTTDNIYANGGGCGGQCQDNSEIGHGGNIYVEGYDLDISDDRLWVYGQSNGRITINYSSSFLDEFADYGNNFYLTIINGSSEGASIAWENEFNDPGGSLTFLYGNVFLGRNYTNVNNPSLNAPATIELYGDVSSQYNVPGIYRDDQLCTDCTVIGNLRDDPVRFMVTGFSSYGIGEKPLTINPISDCQDLDEELSVYILDGDISFDGDTCFTILADDVELDLNGFTISSISPEDQEIAVHVDGFDRSFVRNGTISDFYEGVLIEDSQGSIVEYLNFDISLVGTVANGYMVQILNGGNHIVRNNNITGEMVGNPIAILRGIDIANSEENLVENNNIFSFFGFPAETIKLSGESNTISNNRLENISGMGLFVNSHNNLFENNFIKNVSDHAIRIFGGHNNEFTGNVIDESRKDAIFIETGNGNILDTMQVTNTEAGFSDLRTEFQVTHVDIIDTHLAAFEFNTVQDFGTLFTFEDRNEGKIEFLRPLDGDGDSLSDTVNIGFNSAFVDTISEPAMGVSADISLYNNPGQGLENRFISKDGNACDTPYCNILQGDLGSETVVFNVTDWSTYSIGGSQPQIGNDDDDDDDDDDDNPIKSFSLDKSFLVVDLSQGEQSAKSFLIENTGDLGMQFSVSVQDLSQFITFSEVSFTISSGSSKTVVINFDIPPSTVPGVYEGKILVTAGGSTKEILVSTTIDDVDKLFDVDMDLITSLVSKDDELEATVTLIDVGNVGYATVDLEFVIKEQGSDTEIVLQQDEEIVEGSKTIIRKFEVPAELELNKDYLFITRVSYEGSVASSAQSFKVTNRGISNFDSVRTILLWLVFFIVLIAIAAFVIIFIRKMQLKEQSETINQVNTVSGKLPTLQS